MEKNDLLNEIFFQIYITGLLYFDNVFLTVFDVGFGFGGAY